MSQALVQDALLNAALTVTKDQNNPVTVTAAQATEIAAALPAPYAMESLAPQVGRQLLVAIGGYVVGRGWVSSELWTQIAGLAMVAGPILWRIGRTYLERKKFI